MRRVALVAVVGALALAACSGDSEAKVQPYDHAPVPAVPDHTHEVLASGTPADGDYWAPDAVADTTSGTINFGLVQAFFGPMCTAELGAEQCDGDMGVRPEPSITWTASAANLTSISVVAENRQNYAVPGSELVSLLAGDPPGSRAPEGFALQQYPYLITIEAGVVTEVHQIWMP